MAKTKNKGILAEERLLKRMSVLPDPWKPQKVMASGAMPNKKGDLKSERCLIENKQTDADSFSLKRSWLSKIEREATEQGGRLGAMAIQMGVNPIDEIRVVVLLEADFMELVTELEAWRNDQRSHQ